MGLNCPLIFETARTLFSAVVPASFELTGFYCTVKCYVIVRLCCTDPCKFCLELYLWCLYWCYLGFL